MLGTLLIVSTLATMPAFKLESAGAAAPLDSRTLAGRAYVVQFFASWCTSCAGVAGAVQAEVARTPVRYVAVSLDEDVGAAGKGPLGPAAYFDRGRTLATKLGDVGVPTVVVVDASGHIQATIAGHFGPAQRGELAAALARGAVP